LFIDLIYATITTISCSLKWKSCYEFSARQGLPGI